LADTRCVAYFCGPFLDAITDPASALKKTRDLAHLLLQNELPQMWSFLQTKTELDRLLVAPEGRTGTRLDAQFWRANVVGSDRYVQSSPGTIVHRLPAERSGFDNLFLAGDWTNNGLNVGCAEAAVMSGMQAARGVSKRDPHRTWITVWGER
jgi:uncharacterized protein with NAD-binding domain and iron-sulfur cluster